MKRVLVIIKKEFTDMMRDRRTVMLMLVLPLLIFPVLMNLMTSITASQQKKAEVKILKVGLISREAAPEFRARLLERKDMTVSENIDETKVESLIQDKSHDFVIVFEKDFSQKVAGMASGNVEVFYKQSSENEIAKKRITEVLDEFKNSLLDARLKEKQLDRSFVEPVTVTERDLASVKEKLGEYIGGFLPYIFILFCFIGAMYPAIDLAAGEKERATLETLLTSPASRMQIVLGKFIVVTSAGLVSAILSMAGLFLAVKMNKEIPQKILSGIMRIIEPTSLLLMASLLVPLCVFFAALLLSISIFAKSFKEAQSLMTPMNFMVIIPVAVGTIPGIKLTVATAWIPVLNVSLATKDIIAGTIDPFNLAMVYISLFILAAGGLFFCSRWFQRESVIFRGI